MKAEDAEAEKRSAEAEAEMDKADATEAETPAVQSESETDEGEGVSHGCINLDAINCEFSGAQPLELSELQFSYRVFLSGPTVFRAL